MIFCAKLIDFCAINTEYLSNMNHYESLDIWMRQHRVCNQLGKLDAKLCGSQKSQTSLDR